MGTLLYCHGNAGNISHRVPTIAELSRLGLNILIFDYRGYGRSEGAPSEKGLYMDARAAYEYLIGREDIDPGRIAILGKSLGASVAIDLASRVEAACLIADGGFSSAGDMAGRIFPFLPARRFISVGFDSEAKIKDIRIPKLIIHSRDDELVPFDLGEKLYRAAADPKEFHAMRGGHNEAIYMEENNYYGRIGEFLGKHLEKK
jgi:hypothetical protein